MNRSPELNAEIITDPQGFEVLRPLWNDLFAKKASPSPLSSWAYVSTWWQHFGEHLFVVIVKEGDIVRGIFPFSFGPKRFFALRRLRPLGYNGELEPNGLTEEPLHLIEPGYEPDCIQTLLSELAKGLSRGEWDCVLFNHWSEDSEAQVSDGFNQLSGHIAWKKRKAGINIASLPTTWDAYKKQLSKSMRENLPYYPKLLKRHGHTWSVELRADCSAVGTLVEMHRNRAEQDPNNAHENYFPSHQQEAFFEEVCKALTASKAGFVSQLLINDKCAACQLYVRTENTLLAHYSGFDPAWSKYSPLFILQAAVFKEALEDGIQYLDLLQGNALWQQRWDAKPKGQLMRIFAVRKHPLSVFRAALYVFKREGKAFWRRSGLRRKFSR